MVSEKNHNIRFGGVERYPVLSGIQWKTETKNEIQINNCQPAGRNYTLTQPVRYERSGDRDRRADAIINIKPSGLQIFCKLKKISTEQQVYSNRTLIYFAHFLPAFVTASDPILSLISIVGYENGKHFVPSGGGALGTRAGTVIIAGVAGGNPYRFVSHRIGKVNRK